MTVYDTRRANLASLEARYRSRKVFAEQYGIDYAWLTQLMMGPPKGRRLGERGARDLERKLLLPLGWLDNPASAAEPQASTFARQVAAELRDREIPKPMQETILYLLRTVPNTTEPA